MNTAKRLSLNEWICLLLSAQVKNDPGELIGQMSSPVSKKINSSKGFSTTTCF